jgi:hypothetical protein
MLLGYIMVAGGRSAPVKWAGRLTLIVSGIFLVLDIYFDSLTADYLRFGEFVALKDLPMNVRSIQVAFRGLIGGISVVGEGLAVAIILGMPVLKGIIKNAMPTAKQETRRPEVQPQPQPNRDNRQRPRERFHLEEPFDHLGR